MLLVPIPTNPCPVGFNRIFAFVGVGLDDPASVNVDEAAVPPLIVAFPPKLKLVVAPRLNPDAVVNVARLVSDKVVAVAMVSVVEPDVIVFPVRDMFPAPKSSVPTLEIFFVAAAIFCPSVIFPVFASPRVRLCFAVVASVPFAERYTPPEVPADKLATGVALPALLIKANFALLVEVPPNKTSKVLFAGDKALLLICQ